MKKRDFNADRIAALLNKIPDAANEPSSNFAPEDTPRKPVHGQSSGTEMTMSVNEIDALRAKIAQCWNPPPGGLGADAIIVKLRLQLNPDGSLIGYPTRRQLRRLAVLPGGRGQRRARRVPVPALRPARRQIWGVARHDSHF